MTQLLQKCGVMWREAPPHQPPSLAAAALEIFCSFTATQGLPGLLVFVSLVHFFKLHFGTYVTDVCKTISGFVYLSDFEPLSTNSCRNCHGGSFKMIPVLFTGRLRPQNSQT